MSKIFDFKNFLNKLNESVAEPNLIEHIDYTLLNPSATENDILDLCEKANNLGVKSVCVLPKMVKVAADALSNSPVLVCTVISFPHGTDTTEQKLAETKQAIANGADECDMVLNYPRLKELTAEEDPEYGFDLATDELVTDVLTLVDECHTHTNKDGESIILKVIVESSMLNEIETQNATNICIDAGADFIKTSTGMKTPDGKTGIAELDKVQIMRNIINEEGSDMKIKASGGIRTLADLKKFAPYVDRFGVGFASVDSIFGGAEVYLRAYETYCKTEKVDKSFLGHKYTKTKKIQHKWDLVKIGKFMNTDHDGTTFMVKFRCSECGAEVQRHFAEWTKLLEIGVPNEIMKKYQDKSYDYSLRFSKWYAGELEEPIPTNFTEDTNLY
jgi:deoxyribose-phosphate aldolase